MKTLTVLILGIILFAACKNEIPKNENIQTDQKTELPNNKLIAIDYSVNPSSIKAGEPAELFFEVKNSSGEIIKDFDIVHEKLIHLIVVSEDLKEFYHIHPEQQTDGSFKVDFTFPERRLLQALCRCHAERKFADRQRFYANCRRSRTRKRNINC